MKQSVLLLALLVLFQFATAQAKDKTSGSDDLRFNAYGLLFGAIGISYGHVTSDDSSVGIHMNKALDYDAVFNRLFTIAPYYRIYFSSKRAAGFFFETNFTVYQNKTHERDGSNHRDESDSEIGAGPGIAIGGKFIVSHGFVLDLYGGIGRALNDTSDLNKIFASFGVGIGKRF